MTIFRKKFRCPRLLQSGLVGVLAALLPWSAARASLIPNWWTLDSTINFTNSGGGGDGVYTQFTQVQPDFVNAHGVAQSGATIATQYIIHILQDSADYTITAQHHCDNTAGIQPRCISTGDIRLTTTTDVLVSASGSYSYQMPSDPMSAGLSFIASDYTAPHTLFLDSAADNTDLSGPHNGTRTISVSGVVPAGTSVRFTYTMDMSFYSGAAQVPADASGSIHFTMTAVPEPATLALLAPTALLLARKRRRA